MWTFSMNWAQPVSSVCLCLWKSSLSYCLYTSNWVVWLQHGHCVSVLGFTPLLGWNHSSTPLFSVPSYPSLALPLHPHHGSFTWAQTHTLGLVHVWSGLYWMNLSEPLITTLNTLLMNMHMLSDCSRTVKQDYSASQQPVPSRIPSFIYKYTQRWAVSGQPSLTYWDMSDFPVLKRDFTSHHQQHFSLYIPPFTKAVNKKVPVASSASQQ